MIKKIFYKLWQDFSVCNIFQEFFFLNIYENLARDFEKCRSKLKFFAQNLGIKIVYEYIYTQGLEFHSY